MATVLSAADFHSLRLQYKNERGPQDLPAAIEHLFPDGVMVDHFYVQVAPALLEDADLQALGGVSGILFVQQKDAPWLVHFQEASMVREVCFELPDSEMMALLAACGVTLPG